MEAELDKRKVIYYEDELNDEFSLAKITPRKIDENYVYVHSSFFKKLTHFFWYRIVAMPIAFFYTKLKFHHKIVNKEVLKPYKRSGYFIYGNHTQDIGDAFMPNMFNITKDKYMIVHPNNVSMPVVGKISPSLGALPLPDGMGAYRNFMKAIEHHINKKHAIVVYPEAHIWPFYTKIRNFPDTSFQYPIKYDVPAFCFTNTYQKRRLSKKPRIVTYIDGPFFPNKELPLKEQRKDLRDRIYDCMCQRAKKSEVTWIEYIKKDNDNG
ncbi:MAG: hypothetical protein J6B34_05405 [Clostridia bacterium]|nr:hypothetical protein [Clostridia bacterium]